MVTNAADAGQRQQWWRGAVVGALVLGSVAVAQGGALDAQTGEVPPGSQTPLPNPPVSDSCGTNVTLVLDASGSINSSNAVDDVRDAGEAFLDALADTGSTARVLQFGSISEELAAQAEVTAASLQPGGVFRDAITGYYNPRPQRPPTVSIFRYDGSGDPQSAGNWDPTTDNQWTNWDQSLDQAGQAQALPTELILYVTDGDPTSYDFNQPGDPFDAGPPPDVGNRTDRGQAAATTLNRAIEEANEAKAVGTRILAVGVGNAVTGNPASVQRLVQISGPQTVDDDGLDAVDSINDVDVALVRDFDKLALFLRSVVSELCSPSLAIRKLAQTPDDAGYEPAPNWSITTTPVVANGGTYRWILPDSGSPDERARCGNPTNPNDQQPRTCLTSSVGLTNFQWEPDPSDADTSATVTETLQPGYVAGRPGADNDWTCTFKNVDGSQFVQSGEFTAGGSPGFQLDVDPEQIITCNIYNSFSYAPAIALTKVNDPTIVRGDLTAAYGGGPAKVTSTFEVTNPGNTPLVGVDVDDDLCAPVVPSTKGNGNNVGDLDDDGALDTTETWVFTCVRSITRGITTNPINIVNTATATGTDPTGTPVTSAPVTDDVDVVVPAISIDKTVEELRQGADPRADEITVVVPAVPVSPPGVPVRYTYEVTSSGNTPLAVALPTDDTCGPLVPDVVATPDGPRNVGDTINTPLGLLDTGEIWRYTCDAGITDTTTNRVGVSGVPTPPSGTPGSNPAVTDPNPPVTATDTAKVTLLPAGIRLDKSVDRSLVFPGTTVVYTYVVTNTDAAPLRPPGVDPAPGSGPGSLVVVDDTCSSTGTLPGPVTFVQELVGNNDERLDQNERWEYTCSTAITQRTLNTATVQGEVLGGDFIPTGTILTDQDTALVEVSTGAIAVEKTALRPAVLDPAAPAVFGPDVPNRRPASYEYAVSNPGSLPLDLTAVNSDVDRIVDDKCAPVVPTLVSTPQGSRNVGDANLDLRLDVDEIWQYTCTQVLDKADGIEPTPPPQPAIVTNTVTVTGTPLLVDGTAVERGTDVSATDTADVLVVQPALRLTKTPCLDVALTNCVDNPLVRPDTPITYRYQVANVGDTGIVIVDGGDDKCDGIEFVGGDGNGNGILDGGVGAETWTYRCTTPVNFPSPVVNTAVVFGVGPLENVYVATDDAQVRVFDPAIDLVKSVSSNFVPVGSEVTYTFEVTNAGDPGAAGVPADVVLSEIVLVDVTQPANPNCSRPAFQGGDTNGNSRLDKDPAEVWTYTCTGVINEQTIDVAGVSGLDILGAPVFDFDGEIVTPFVAGIEIVKTADPTMLPVGGGPVTYRYEVVNTGEVPLAEVNTRVTDDKCAPVEPVLEGGFNIGDVDRNNLLTSDTDIFEAGGAETWLFTCRTTLTATTLNTATTLGTPVRPAATGPAVIGPDVSASDTARVTVPLAGSITIVKDARPDSSTPFAFTGSLGAFSLVDNGSGLERRTFDGLAPGEYEVREAAPLDWMLDSIVCTDPTGDTLVDVAAGRANIALGDGESVTCTYINVFTGQLPVTGGGDGIADLIVAGGALTALGVLLLAVAGRRRRTTAWLG